MWSRVFGWYRIRLALSVGDDGGDFGPAVVAGDDGIREITRDSVRFLLVAPHAYAHARQPNAWLRHFLDTGTGRKPFPIVTGANLTRSDSLLAKWIRDV
jgi:hypothetical protein